MRERILIAGAVLALAACGGSEGSSGDTAAAARSSGGVDLTGAGATFPYPIYSKWFSDYAAKSGVRINYQSIGSGGGIRQLSEGTVDFGATDSPMSDEEMGKAKGGAVYHFPTVIGAVAVAYNLPGLQAPIKLSGEALGEIYLGNITRWNDQRIASLNPGVQLPAKDILVVYRSDGSGTTYVFTDYLSAASPKWAQGPGKGKEIRWPVGIGGKGNEGVAGQVKQADGALGYMELAYAKQNDMPVAAIRNQAGSFVVPSIASATAAADGALAQMGQGGGDYRVSIVNAQGAEAYPITSFTWLLVYRQQADSAKGRKLVDFLRWAYADGQQSAATLDYAPLPQSLRDRLVTRLDSVQLGAAR
jgi:phosphate transport system substrate-binding protein